ncbi:MAG TPA: hypothetical protein QF433_04085, partial [Candidatus Thalassarchaeaceae archaeon]|nr:hypothetical protein [Candidatus Thalassarchaeaceae archaeon]
QLVSAATLADANWSDMAENETKVQLTPGLVGGGSMKEKDKRLCKSCELPGVLTESGYCAVCSPYSYRAVYNIAHLVPWARTMIVQERDILDDVEPLRPPTSDAGWLELLQQIIPPGYGFSRNLSLEVAVEAARNYPTLTVERVEIEGDGGTIFYSTENPDADDDDYIPQQFNEWKYELENEDDKHPSTSDEYLSKALVENISGATTNDPIKRVSQIRNLCNRVLNHQTFLIDSGSYDVNSRRWGSILPECLILREVLAEVLMGYHGQEPLWRLRAGVINDTVYWRNYLSTESWEEPRKKSFQFLRQIVQDNSEIKPTSKGLVIQGESGAKYLLKGQQFHEGVPTTIVLNLPKVTGISGFVDRSVCIHMERGCKLPLGDRIAALALGLVNDVKTAREIEQLARVVDEFQEQGWR